MAKIVVVALVVAAQAALGLSAAIAPASAEEVLGCPLGLEKGQFWALSIAKYTEHTEWFNPSSGYMEPLPAGWYSKKTEIPVRLGYGVSDRLDVGVVFPWQSRRLRKKQGPDWIEKDDSGLGDIWVAAKYKFLYEPDPLARHLAFGVAYRFHTASDAHVRNGVGTGAEALRLGLLYHAGLNETDELCAHLTYEFGDTVRAIPGFAKSGYRNADRISYKLFGEKLLGEKTALSFGPTGWWQTDETRKPNGDGGDTGLIRIVSPQPTSISREAVRWSTASWPLA